MMYVYHDTDRNGFINYDAYIYNISSRTIGPGIRKHVKNRLMTVFDDNNSMSPVIEIHFQGTL